MSADKPLGLCGFVCGRLRVEFPAIVDARFVQQDSN
jgi:hypothetical protein